MTSTVSVLTLSYVTTNRYPVTIIFVLWFVLKDHNDVPFFLGNSQFFEFQMQLTFPFAYNLIFIICVIQLISALYKIVKSFLCITNDVWSKSLFIPFARPSNRFLRFSYPSSADWYMRSEQIPQIGSGWISKLEWLGDGIMVHLVGYDTSWKKRILYCEVLH